MRVEPMLHAELLANGAAEQRIVLGVEGGNLGRAQRRPDAGTGADAAAPALAGEADRLVIPEHRTQAELRLRPTRHGGDLTGPITGAPVRIEFENQRLTRARHRIETRQPGEMAG